MAERIKKVTKLRVFWPSVALALIILFNILFVKDFLKIEVLDGVLFGRIIDILKNGAPLVIMSIGMTLVIATGGIDISVGSVSAISGAVVCTLIGANFNGKPNMPFILAIFIALLVTTLTGAWNGFLVAKLKMQPVVATLILYVAGRGIAQLITQGQIARVYYYQPFSWLGAFAPGIPFPFAILIIAVVLAIVIVFVKKTAFGIFLESSGVNSQASKFTGIPVTKIKFMAYMICGLCAGIAGLIIASMVKSADANNAGLLYELDAILAVAIGGTSLNGGRFSIAASVIGALIVQSITTTMYAVGVAAQVLPLVKAIVVIVICLFQAEEFRKKVITLFKMRRRVQNEKNSIKL